MLHEPVDDCNVQLNFHLSTSLSKQNLDLNNQTTTTSNSQLSSLLNGSICDSNESSKKSNIKENFVISLNSRKSDLLPASNSAEKLSWKFFEQVDSLDNQLRSDVSSPPSALLNGSAFFLNSPTTKDISTSSLVSTSTTITTTNDVNLIVANSLNALGMHSNHHLQQQQQQQTNQTLPQGCNRKSNGYAINGTIQTTEILSQTNATTNVNTTTATTAATANDLNFLPQLRLTPQTQQTEQPATTFVFTSPTSTFKRKKQQQLLKEKQEVEQQRQTLQQQRQQLQQEHYNNNLYKIGNSHQERPIGTTESATTLSEDYHSRTTIVNTNKRGSNLTPKRQQQQPRINSNNTNPLTNDTKTVINNSLGVLLTDTVTYAPSSSSATTLSYINGNGTLNRNSNVNGSTRLTFKTHTLPAITKTTTPSTFITDGVVDLVATTNVTKSKTLTGQGNRHNKLSASFKRRQKMQASSSGGSGTTTATAKGNSTTSLMDDIEMHLGLIGWRKKCLYTLLVLLMLLIIINLGLTLWILKVMEFSTEGMGQLKIVPGGIQLTGQALIMDMLRASTIRSRHGQPIAIESSRNFSINTRDTNGMLENHLFLGHDKLECMATGFRINDTNGRNLFSVNRNEVTIGAHALRIDGEGGAIFRESIQTPHVRAEPGRELRLESPTRQLEMTAAKDINFQSRAGGIEISALEDVKLTALDGSLRFESSKIFMPNLRTVQLPLPGTQQSREHLHRVFQLCACANGKLFLAAPHSICAGDDTTVCR
ncbi:Delta-sarcoglycan [Lucilia cuprina]|nr:Delta-sarcoglycan [Lucilia cuprina]KAI8118842.1 Delta-sarcoglycan [Lucilia cuprina]